MRRRRVRVDAVRRRRDVRVAQRGPGRRRGRVRGRATRPTTRPSCSARRTTRRSAGSASRCGDGSRAATAAASRSTRSRPTATSRSTSTPTGRTARHHRPTHRSGARGRSTTKEDNSGRASTRRPRPSRTVPRTSSPSGATASGTRTTGAPSGSRCRPAPTHAGAAVNDVQDVLQPGGGGIRVLRWVDPNRLWVLHSRSLLPVESEQRRDLATAADPDLAEGRAPPGLVDRRLRPTDLCNDIAVHDPARGTTGSAVPRHAGRPVGRRLRPALVVRRFVEVVPDRVAQEDDRVGARGRRRARPPRHRVRRNLHRRLPHDAHVQRQRPGVRAVDPSRQRPSGRRRAGPLDLLGRPDPAAACGDPGPRGLGARPERAGRRPNLRARSRVRHPPHVADVARRAVRRQDRRPGARGPTRFPCRTRGTQVPTSRVHPKLGAMAAAVVAPLDEGEAAGRVGRPVRRVEALAVPDRAAQRRPPVRADRHVGRRVRRRAPSQRRTHAGRQGHRSTSRSGRASSRRRT